jgi:hypothetical protein
VASPPGGAAKPCGEGHLAHLWRRPFAYKDPPTGKPKDPINFPETHRDLSPSSIRDRESPEALPDTLPEREIATGGLIHRHACLQRNEYVVYLGLWVHSSSLMVVFSTMCFMFRFHELPYMIEIIFV